MNVSIRIFKALEDLHAKDTSSADRLAAYYILRTFLAEIQSTGDVVESDVPLILRGINKKGAYEYDRREVTT